MKYRKATKDDLSLLAEWNLQLIADEGHRNPMSFDELKTRMTKWLSQEYDAIIFSDTKDVAYALFKENAEEIYLRQFFVVRERRRAGIGREAMGILINEIWPRNKRLIVDVLSKNVRGLKFWRSIGYKDYSVCLELPPEGK